MGRHGGGRGSLECGWYQNFQNFKYLHINDLCLYMRMLLCEYYPHEYNPA